MGEGARGEGETPHPRGCEQRVDGGDGQGGGHENVWRGPAGGLTQRSLKGQSLDRCQGGPRWRPRPQS